MAMNRREFLKLGVCGCFASSLSNLDLSVYSEAFAEEALDNLKIVEHTLKIGATKPFTAVHISDTHLTFADERETERKQKLAQDRARYFNKAEINLRAAVSYAKQKDALLLHTGDMIDFLSEKNFEFVSAFYQESEMVPHFVSSGNHEFSHYLGEAKEDEAYKLQSFDRVQKAFPNDLRFCSRIVNGINFVAFDDVYYYVADNIVELFQKEIDKGLPIVTMCHVPFYTPELYRFMIEDRKERISYTMGTPDDKNENTAKFLKWLKEQPLMKAHLCGHLHVNHVDQFSEHAKQYVVGGNFKGDVFVFHFE
ncbi:MAG: metallophosphoesterase [Thermoguttaceae bacterium]|nr:metallophosphoesterase [Thermoguttaceae bacterium]